MKKFFVLLTLVLFSWTGLAHAATTPEFTVKTERCSWFEFQISAAGTYEIDWGDGNVETITKTNTTETTYSHDYSTAGEYTIGISGQATAYASNTSVAAISVSSASNLAGISGSLGAIFGTLDTETNNQPGFNGTFSGCSNLTGTIPENLFSGITGAPVEWMFWGTFFGCSGLTGSIPADLFKGISGAPAIYMFAATFSGCSGLTGDIPKNLFSGIKGAPARQMFQSTFNGCSGLSGSIPAGLFGNISGAPAYDMFASTFNGCSGLTGSIPADLFKGISGAPAYDMFASTFNGCSGLTGSIPADLFSGITGKPAESMFQGTFSGCSKLTGSIPENLFSGIQGKSDDTMFASTFNGCSSLTGYVPGNLFTVAGVSYESYGDTFTNATGLATVCPMDTYIDNRTGVDLGVAVCSPCPAGTISPENSPNIDACIVGCHDGFELNTVGTCSELCGAGFRYLRTSTGLKVPIFATQNTNPALAFGDTNATVCYADLVAGQVSNEIHVRYNGTVYHTVQRPE